MTCDYFPFHVLSTESDSERFQTSKDIFVPLFLAVVCGLTIYGPHISRMSKRNVSVVPVATNHIPVVIFLGHVRL